MVGEGIEEGEEGEEEGKDEGERDAEACEVGDGKAKIMVEERRGCGGEVEDLGEEEVNGGEREGV